MRFHEHTVCKCGWFKTGRHFIPHYCPGCGRYNGDHFFQSSEWIEVTRCWVSLAVWWKPRTWGRGGWFTRAEMGVSRD